MDLENLSKILFLKDVRLKRVSLSQYKQKGDQICDQGPRKPHKMNTNSSFLDNRY